MSTPPVTEFFEQRPLVVLETLLAVVVLAAFGTGLWLVADGQNQVVETVDLFYGSLGTGGLLTLVVLSHGVRSVWEWLRTDGGEQRPRHRPVTLVLRAIQTLVAVGIIATVAAATWFFAAVPADPSVGAGGYAFVVFVVLAVGSLALAVATLASSASRLAAVTPPN